MTASTEDLARRVEKLERLLRSRSMEDRDDVHGFWRHIPFGAWLKISGPTFAVMALGFGLVWDAQQETTRQVLALQRETTAKIAALQQETSDRILVHQREVASEIMAHQREVTDRIFEVQERILDMQQQVLEIQRETRAGRS